MGVAVNEINVRGRGSGGRRYVDGLGCGVEGRVVVAVLVKMCVWFCGCHRASNGMVLRTYACSLTDSPHRGLVNTLSCI